MNVKKVAATMTLAALATGIFASAAMADTTPAPSNPPAQTQHHDRKEDHLELRKLLKELRAENKQERALRRQLHQDVKEMHRLVKLSKQAQVTDDLKMAYAEVERVRQDLKVIHETRQQWKTEWNLFRDYYKNKDLDKATVQAKKLRSILELQIDQLQSASAKAKKLIIDLRADLRNVGINPDQM